MAMLRRSLRALLPALLMGVAATAAEQCSCERIVALEAEVANLRGTTSELAAAVHSATAAAKVATRLVEQLEQRRATTAALATPATPTASIKSVQTNADVMVEPTADARRLSGSGASTFVSVGGRFEHVFPGSHACPDPSGYMQELPILLSGAASFKPSPSEATGNHSLVKVGTDWSTTAIASFPAPLRMLHDASCSAPPTLELPLSTSVQTLSVTDSLTVNGATIGGGLAWTSLSLQNAATSVSGKVPQYAVKDGLVYLRGAVSFSSCSGTAFVTSCRFANLPASACSLSREAFAMTGYDHPSVAQVVIRLVVTTGGDMYMRFYTGSSWSEVNSGTGYLDGVMFPCV